MGGGGYNSALVVFSTESIIRTNNPVRNPVPRVRIPDFPHPTPLCAPDNFQFTLHAKTENESVSVCLNRSAEREWESWRMKKSLVESEMKQKLAQLHEKFIDKMKHQLNCLQEETQQSFQNFQQELDKAYNGELLKLQNENENLKKEQK
ncbi:hypothetical protein DAPPUDRAFT_107684 [Daphnia pulex]|uniref:Uncharacterized protein n=1 Tax=Daphnia pulex TaxID=6669 RepID=E9GXX2_DAPPU|nr:hypothetical protein DAPPUDRAFT_107684 [Daphnia pulex]|eukprot:EFX75734.1 hypothetical protein DAPPUDRAFT_107684 [Daphnia pulex]